MRHEIVFHDLRETFYFCVKKTTEKRSYVLSLQHRWCNSLHEGNYGKKVCFTYRVVSASVLIYFESCCASVLCNFYENIGINKTSLSKTETCRWNLQTEKLYGAKRIFYDFVVAPKTSQRRVMLHSTTLLWGCKVVNISEGERTLRALTDYVYPHPLAIWCKLSCNFQKLNRLTNYAKRKVIRT